MATLWIVIALGVWISFCFSKADGASIILTLGALGLFGMALQAVGVW